MEETTGLFGVFEAGGVMMIFLGIASLLMLAVVIEKFWNLRRALVAPEASKEVLLSLLEAGAVDRVREYCAQNPMPLTRLVAAALRSQPFGRNDMKEAIVDQGRQEVAILERFLVLLGTIAAVSPLMGLMGTVLGMMETFDVISRVGPGQSDQLSGGISEALITTVSGLAIAVPALLFHNIFHARVGRYVLEMENFTLHVMRMLGADGAGPGSEAGATGS